MMTRETRSFRIRGRVSNASRRPSQEQNPEPEEVVGTGTIIQGRTSDFIIKSNTVRLDRRPLVAQGKDSPLRIKGGNKLSSTQKVVKSEEEFKTGEKVKKENTPSPFNSATKMYYTDENELVEAIDLKTGALIGEGAYGKVYKALNKKTGKFLAVKSIQLVGDLSQSFANLEDLNREIPILRQLSHENIVQLYSYSVHGETVQLYMELMPGGSIASMLKQFGRFEEPVIKRFTRQILNGLVYLHSKGVIHRDLKGANILTDNFGNVKLADFGSSHIIINVPLLTASQTAVCTSMKGSLYWMAPEVLNQERHGKRVDIWSLGCTIIEMATASYPWPRCETFLDFITLVNQERTPPIPTTLSEAGQDFVRKCCTFEKRARPTAAMLQEHDFLRED
eukprot:TRINITY_DN2043_c0_g1_i4.p1 TRINITY_DN2043_c0_g1~~TRINITY_DN2043_c0_g1_i4.p1  ORF type:complete len:393 (+),score=67.18 TRINITY_DN2043_c0_g1_i4:379-1557(+)